jgi:hypothetical protein
MPMPYYSGGGGAPAGDNGLKSLFWFIGFPILAFGGLTVIAHVVTRPRLELKLVRFQKPCQGYNVMARVQHSHITDQRIIFENVSALTMHGYNVASLKEIHDKEFDYSYIWNNIGKLITTKEPEEVRQDLKLREVRARFACVFDSVWIPRRREFKQRHTVQLHRCVEDELR